MCNLINKRQRLTPILRRVWRYQSGNLNQ